MPDFSRRVQAQPKRHPARFVRHVQRTFASGDDNPTAQSSRPTASSIAPFSTTPTRCAGPHASKTRSPACAPQSHALGVSRVARESVRGLLPPDGLAPGDSLVCPGRPTPGPAAPPTGCAAAARASPSPARMARRRVGCALHVASAGFGPAAPSPLRRHARAYACRGLRASCFALPWRAACEAKPWALSPGGRRERLLAPASIPRERLDQPNGALNPLNSWALHRDRALQHRPRLGLRRAPRPSHGGRRTDRSRGALARARATTG
jgi:hypothetical protein